jgi:hypothetical protein
VVVHLFQEQYLQVVELVELILQVVQHNQTIQVVDQEVVELEVLEVEIVQLLEQLILVEELEDKGQTLLVNLVDQDL